LITRYRIGGREERKGEGRGGEGRGGKGRVSQCPGPDDCFAFPFGVGGRGCG